LILGLGVDMCDVERIRRALEGPTGDHFRARVFTPDVISVTGPTFIDGRLYLRNLREMAAFSLGG